jgi:predicted DCC family thiol-disulfide oxidoreductase YuxK
MGASPAQPAPHGEGHHLVLYDGVCGLCSQLVQFVLARDRRGIFHFASLQSVPGQAWIARVGGNPYELSSLFVVANYRTTEPQALVRSRAALFVAGALGWPWKISCVLGVLPTRLLDLLYDLVARYRYRVFGRSEQCFVPNEKDQARFVG